jgi:hypothetical protein
MKSIIKIMLPTIMFWSASSIGQVSQVNVSDKFEICEANVVLPAKEETKWKDDNVADRKSFYAVEKPFDPAQDYASQYSKIASLGNTPKTETGKIKLIPDNTTAPIVYYNNAAVGTILKLNNPDNGKTTYAVVVGKVSPTDSESYLIVLNERTAKNLSIKDYSSIELTSYSDTLSH